MVRSGRNADVARWKRFPARSSRLSANSSCLRSAFLHPQQEGLSHRSGRRTGRRGNLSNPTATTPAASPVSSPAAM